MFEKKMQRMFILELVKVADNRKAARNLLKGLTYYEVGRMFEVLETLAYESHRVSVDSLLTRQDNETFGEIMDLIRSNKYDIDRLYGGSEAIATLFKLIVETSEMKTTKGISIGEYLTY